MLLKNVKFKHVLSKNIKLLELSKIYLFNTIIDKQMSAENMLMYGTILQAKIRLKK